MNYEPNIYTLINEHKISGHETFKDYCKFILKYRENDISYLPYWFDFAKDVLEDRSFPRKTWYRKIENNSDAYKNYKQSIEDYLDRKHACNAAKEAFAHLWKEYRNFSWVSDEYYEKHVKPFQK